MPTDHPRPILRQRGLRRPEASGSGISAVNQRIQREGAEGRAAGGILGRAGAIGAGLGTKVDMSQALAPSPASPTRPTPTPPSPAGSPSAPLPPTPLVETGVHESGARTPYVPFSPPTARITDPLALTPKVRIEATDTSDLDTLVAGQHLAHALQTPAGPPQVRVTTTGDIGRSSRLDLLVDREMRAENRLYNNA